MKITLRPEPAISLSALRIVVPLLLLVAPGFREGVRVAAWDPARWAVPEGLGWFVSVVPINPSLARVAQVVVAFSGLCAVVGVRARLSLTVLTLSGFYLFSIAQLTGFVWHDMHLLWFSALLAASPCNDVLSVDARYPFDVSGTRYALPLGCFRLLLSAIYFFPGLHKLLTSGIDWALSDNLRNQLYYKWAQHGSVPSFRIDEHAWMLKTGGLFVLAFELAFPLLVNLRRTRLFAAGLGITFHVLSALIFRIPFASLWLCYLGFVDIRPLYGWGARLWARVRGAPAPFPAALSPEPLANRDKRLVMLVGGALLLGAVIQGARAQMRSYPFACYPTFQWRATTAMPDLGLYAIDVGGREREVVHARDASGYRTQRQWAELWSLAGVYGPVAESRLSAYLTAVLRDPKARQQIDDSTRVRFYRLDRSVVPEERDRPPLRRQLLLELTRLSPASI